jgi:hypothetical protein
MDKLPADLQRIDALIRAALQDPEARVRLARALLGPVLAEVKAAPSPGKGKQA